MATIVSRVNKTELELRRLRDIIDAATGGAIGPGGEIEPGTTLAELVMHVDIACASLLALIDKLDAKCQELASDNLQLSTKFAEREQLVKVLSEVEYDEDLEHVTLDLMEALIASGAAETTFDSEISFQADVVLSREDLKPFVRQVVDDWLRLKIR